MSRRSIKTSVNPHIEVALLLAVFIVSGAGSGCSRSSTANEPSIDKGDENLAKAKLAEAEPLYDARADMARARVAVAALRQGRAADYGNYEVAWKLARAAYYVGDHTDNDDERDDMFREGVNSGMAAVKLQPDKPEGHFWLGANYGGTAAHSTLAGLASVQDIKREMEAVLKIDEGFQAGSAYLGLGRLYLQAPKVLGGDPQKSIGYLEKGIKFGPNNSLLRVTLAQAYHAAGRDNEANKELQTLFALTPDPQHLPEHNDALKEGKKLQQKLDLR